MSDLDGDPACWLGEVCEICGGISDGASEHVCRPPAPPAATDTDEQG